MHGGHPLRTAMAIQAALRARCSWWSRWRCASPIEDELFDGSAALYWVLVVGVIAYAASYFARGWLAGHSRFGLYGGLVLLESCSRCLFALAVVIGIASGPERGRARASRRRRWSRWSWCRGRCAAATPRADASGSPRPRTLRAEHRASRSPCWRSWPPSRRCSTAPVVAIDATADRRRAGRLRVQRAADHPRAAAALPGRSRPRCSPTSRASRATEGDEDFAHALRVTLLAIAGFAAAVVIGLPPSARRRWTCCSAATSTTPAAGWCWSARHGLPPDRGHAQPGRAGPRPRGPRRRAWLGCAAVFLAWLALAPLDDQLLAVEVGYCATTAVLAFALWLIERSGARRA